MAQKFPWLRFTAANVVGGAGFVVGMVAGSVLGPVGMVAGALGGSAAGTAAAVWLGLSDEPQAPAVSRIEVVRKNSINFNLSVTLKSAGGGRITHFTVSYRKRGTTDWFKVTEDPIPAQQDTESTMTWTGVITHAELKYDGKKLMEFRVGVYNQQQLISCHEIEETLVRPGPPTSIALISSSTSSLEVEVQLSDKGSFPITQVGIKINKSSDWSLGLATKIMGPSEESMPGETVTMSLTELEEGTEYQLEAYEVNCAGQGPTGDKFTVNTGNYPATPANLETENLSPLSTRVTWSLTNLTTGDAAEHLEVNLKCSNPSINETYEIPGDQTEYTLDVVPGAEYSVTVTAVNQHGKSASTPEEFQAMPAVLPGPPTSIALISSSTSSLEVKVQLSDKGSFPITEVAIMIRSPSGTTHVVSTHGQYNPGDTVTMSLTELEEGTEYQLEAYEVNCAGQGPTSAKFRFGTDSFPATPDNLETENLSPLSTQVTWSLTNQTTRDAAEHLEVNLTCSNPSINETYRIPGNQTQYTLDVVPSAEYSVTVTAVNQHGRSVSTPNKFQAMRKDSAHSVDRKELDKDQVEGKNRHTVKPRGVEFLSNATVRVRRRKHDQVVLWEERGFRMYIPSGALDESEEREIALSTSHSGCFDFPAGTIPVSLVYYVEPSGPFRKPVTLEIEHCCSHGLDQLEFAFAESSSKNPPYKFGLLKKESAKSIHPLHGQMEVSRFSFFAILRYVMQIGREPMIVGCQYRVHVLHQKRGHCDWRVVLVVTERLEECSQAVRRRYQDWMETIIEKVLEFKPVSQQLSMDISEEGDEVGTDGIWRIFPISSPPKIKRSDIHRFAHQEGSYTPANCEMSIELQREDCPQIPIRHTLVLQGVECPVGLRMLIYPNQLQGDRHEDGIPEPIDPRVSQVLTTDDLPTLVSILSPAKSKWHSIGIQLSIQPGLLESLELDYQSTTVRFSRMLTEWLSRVPRPTLDALARALEDPTVGATRLAGELRRAFE